jgi:hypothetical protein
MLYSNETPFQNMKDQFNGNTEKRHPPPHLIGHEVYEMVKNVPVRGKELQRIMKKMTCGRSSHFFGSYRIGKT